MKNVRRALGIFLTCQIGATFGSPAVPSCPAAAKPSSTFTTEDAGLFEGDILLSEGKSINDVRVGLVNGRYRWQGGVVPYTIAPEFSAENVTWLERAFEDYNTKTCTRFIPRTDEPDYIRITNKPEGCYSYVGRIGGPQVVNYDGSCFNRFGSVLHELCHALGFFHEQSRWDRDDYVTVFLENVIPANLENFKKYEKSYADFFGEPYDYGSMMHYGPYISSRNGKPTILPKDPSATIGQRVGFSEIDVRKIKAMYCP